MKLNVFDDNIIITGANLEDQYFTDWEDWYYIIQDAKHLADFCADLNEAIGDCSLVNGPE